PPRAVGAHRAQGRARSRLLDHPGDSRPQRRRVQAPRRLALPSPPPPRARQPRHQQLVERGRAQAARLRAEPEGPRRARGARARLAPLRARDEPRPRRSMTIDDYVAELERELRRRRAPRVRLLRETEDHLHDLCAELAADGLAPEQAEACAVTQFGAAATVA